MKNIKIVVHFPKTKEGQEMLEERIAEQHVKMIKNYINKLNWSPELKLQLWEEVKLKITENTRR